MLALPPAAAPREAMSRVLLTLVCGCVSPPLSPLAPQLNNLAGSLRRAGCKRAGLAASQRAYRAAVETFGHNHPHTVLARSNLAAAMELTGDVDGAIEMLSDAATDLQSVPCRTAEEARLVQFRLAGILRVMGEIQFRHAAATEETAVVDMEVVGEGVALTLAVDEKKRSVAAKMAVTPGRVAVRVGVMSNAIAAAENLGNALDMFDGTVGPQHAMSGETVALLVAVSRSLGRFEEALALQTRLLQMTEAALGPAHRNAAVHRLGIANTLHILGRHAEAAGCLEAGLAHVKQAQGGGKATVLSSELLGALVKARRMAGDQQGTSRLLRELAEAKGQLARSAKAPGQRSVGGGAEAAQGAPGAAGAAAGGAAGKKGAKGGDKAGAGAAAGDGEGGKGGKPKGEANGAVGPAGQHMPHLPARKKAGKRSKE